MIYIIIFVTKYVTDTSSHRIPTGRNCQWQADHVYLLLEGE